MKDKKHIVSFSGGKDSTAMLLMMIEKNMRIDEIIFCDTGMEFPEMYDHIREVEKYIGRKITVLKAENTFEFMMQDYVKTRGKRKGQKGYAFPSFRNRWCTTYFKTQPISRYLRKYKDSEIIEYHGIAFDEPKRIGNNSIKTIKYPLYEWGITEKEALQFCYSKGFTWGGLYEKFKRVSCWCCPLKGLKELKTLYFDYPDLWERLKEMEQKSWNKIRSDYSVLELEQKFNKEKEQ